jgi:hypothetical protein
MNKFLMDDKGNLSLNPDYKQPRKPTANSKIIVDDLETKLKIMEISSMTKENMKGIIKRLVEVNHNQLFGDNNK